MRVVSIRSRPAIHPSLTRRKRSLSCMVFRAI